MSHVDKILAVMDGPSPMTSAQIATASGVPASLVSMYMSRLCLSGKATCVKRKRPRTYQRTNAPAEAIVSEARRTQPVSVFDFGRFS